MVHTVVAALLLLSVACGGGATAPAPQTGRLLRGPQVAQPTTTSIVVAWRSDAAEIGAVEYGPTPALGSEVADAAPTTEHVLTLAGLQPGTRYHYRILLDGVVVSEGHECATCSDDPAAPIVFAALGDTGPGFSQGAVAARVLAANPDLVVHTGDVIYQNGLEEELDPAYFGPYAGLIDRIPFYLSLGNHDTQLHGGGPLLRAVYLPTNSADGSEKFYSFDRGGIHFVALNTQDVTSPGSVQHTWLDGDLRAAAATATWIVVFFHRPPYSNSRHGGSGSLRADLVPLFEAHGVDLVLTGHDHNYERTFPLRDGAPVNANQEPDYVDPGTPVYVVTGGGGRSLYQSGSDERTAFSRSVYHFTRVEVQGRRLDLEAVGSDGAVIDRMSITKSP